MTNAQTVGTCEPGLAEARLDINGVSAGIYNNGILFFKRTGPDYARYEVPVGTGLNSLYAASLWIAGMIDGELRSAATQFGPTEFWPGPIEDDGRRPADCSPYDRIYKVSRADIANLDQTGHATTDIAEWPWQLGAPVKDGDGDPGNYSLVDGDRPKIEGDQSLWWITNDLGNDHAWSLSPPLGIQVSTMAFATSSLAEELNFTTFYRFTVTNKSGHDIDSLHFGMHVDVDIGHAGDDYIGADSVQGIAYGWAGDDFDESEEGYGSRPPAVGMTVLEGPAAGGTQLGITNAMRYVSPFEPWWGPREVYAYLRSRWLDDQPVTFGGDGRTHSDIPSPFMYTGRPPAFWSEEDIDGAGTRNVPADRRFIWSTGPFGLANGESADILMAIVWARGVDRFDSVYKLLDAVPVVKQAYRDGLAPFLLPRPTGRPRLQAPDAGVSEQPSRVTLSWQDVALADGYEIEIQHADAVVVGEHIRTRPFPTSISPGTASFVAQLDRNQTYSWRVRPSNAAGFGPWSALRSFTTGPVDLAGPGPLRIGHGDEEWAFVQVHGIGDDDACGPSASSTFGCEEAGGNFVYGSFNGQGDWVMYHTGGGPEASLGAFAPRDFEIRVTDEGSYGYYGFTSGNLIPVPFETWDIGPTGPFGVNDPSDDIQMAPYLFADAGGECDFGFGEGEDPFGIGWQITDRIYAYYTDPDYETWQAAARALVDAHPDRCPGSPETDDVDVFVNRSLGRPLQRLIFMMDPSDPDYRPEMIPVGNVIRFLTTKPTPPQPSAPAPGAVVSSEVTLYWQMPPNADTSRVQVASTSDFGSIVTDRTVAGNHFEVRGLEAGTYHWRVSYGDEDWSETWSFAVVPGTSVEDRGPGLPTTLELKPPYPNPSDGPRSLAYGVPGRQRVSLAVYDLLGRRVDVISDREQTAGWHAETWDPEALSAGAYFIVLESGTHRRAQPVIIAR